MASVERLCTLVPAVDVEDDPIERQVLPAGVIERAFEKRIGDLLSSILFAHVEFVEDGGVPDKREVPGEYEGVAGERRGRLVLGVGLIGFVLAFGEHDTAGVALDASIDPRDVSLSVLRGEFSVVARALFLAAERAQFAFESFLEFPQRRPVCRLVGPDVHGRESTLPVIALAIVCSMGVRSVASGSDSRNRGAVAGLETLLLDPLCVSGMPANERAREEVLELLSENARYSTTDLARFTDLDEEDVEAAIEELEDSGTIRGYQAIVDPNRVGAERVQARVELNVTLDRETGYEDIARRLAGFSEVQSLRLVSGDYDFALDVEADSMDRVSRFVSEKVARLPEITQTVTHYVMDTYKDRGIEMGEGSDDDRLSVSP